MSIFSSSLRDSVAVFVAAFQDVLPPNVPEELLMCTLLVLFLKHGKSPCFVAKHSFQCFDRACATWGDDFWCETAYVPFQIFGHSVSIRCCMMWRSSQAVSWSKSLSLRGEDSWDEISSFTCSNVSIWREMSHTKKGYPVESHWETKKPLVINSQHSPCSKGLTLPLFDSLLFTYSRDTRTELCRSDYDSRNDLSRGAITRREL